MAGDTEYYKQAVEEYAALKQDTDPEEWDRRIAQTGCYVENMALQLCHAETGDWRACAADMARFKACWAAQGNRERVRTVDR
ncbi:ADR089Cp [Eremothecium gossypii ATCC 10895]|uniref:ADR089Cp n=1 Tax=Eremothecium gossypii (strain ATCC 10895 / CBS 109.51 / FGSC 9923 / NRRL Y-1056) TaxID=284811 RepID=Q75A31_EREGS|nr:ADR089Cp [Eremothecium gossypii ATCC 10895]AAS52009.1 ADR089Cp [Eremothecium gossypii ATCC 10895]AEY96308.1 FADR089Cp [Eremothecium gossypii FDAG1]